MSNTIVRALRICVALAATVLVGIVGAALLVVSLVTTAGADRRI